MPEKICNIVYISAYKLHFRFIKHVIDFSLFTFDISYTQFLKYNQTNYYQRKWTARKFLFRLETVFMSSSVNWKSKT